MKAPVLLSTFWLVLAAAAPPALLRAQTPADPGPGPESPAAECPGEVISEIWVDNHSVFDLSDPGRSRRFDWAFHLANRLHVRTREEVIRRELVFRVGDCYDPELLRESERVLRATDFIAEADIFGVRQPDGSYHVIVDTRDEWSTRVQPQTGSGTGLQLTGLALHEDNLLGTGRKASAFYLRSREERVYGVSYLDPQLFATRWQAGVAIGRTPLGALFQETVEYPFVGETGRRAFRHHARHHDRYFGYIAADGDGVFEILVPERRRSFDVGAARRFGERGHLTVVGALVEGHWIAYPGTARFEDSDEAIDAADPILLPIAARLDSLGVVRTVVLLGQRNIYFVRRRGLDTVRGVEDVRLGVELELGIGRSIGALSSVDDLSLDVALFTSGQLGRWALFGTSFALEGRRDYQAMPDEPEWVDVFTQLDAWGYLRRSPESRHTLVAALAVSAGWNAQVPFQLTLGGESGLRGHDAHLAPGGHRAVGTLEARSYLGWPYPQLFDLGSVVFVDAGRIWAAGVPYGTNSGIHSNLGFGVRAAFPPGSHNAFRLDVAAPIAAGLSFSDFVITVGVGQAVGRAGRHDPELRRSARRGTARPLFPVRTDREP